MVTKRKLQKTEKDQYTLTIPKILVEILKLKAQDEIEIELQGEKLVLKKHKRGDKRGK